MKKTEEEKNEVQDALKASTLLQGSRKSYDCGNSQAMPNRPCGKGNWRQDRKIGNEEGRVMGRRHFEYATEERI
jgi:hypothetical protein